MSAETLSDIEKSRIAAENRLRQLTRSEADKDEEIRGFGLTEDHPSVARIADLVEGLRDLEADAIKHLEKAMKAHPLGPWIQAQKGIGLKQGARLLGSIGDPYWNDLHDRPRIVSELWAYCGYSVVDSHAQRRTKGEKSNWNAEARMRVRLVSESCIKQRTGSYRRIYDEGRALYDEAKHPVECPQCGPKGKPALPGSLLSLGHQHARALRLVSKEILKDLWIESRRLYQEGVSP